MDPLALIHKYYPAHSAARDILITHSRAVTQKALNIVKNNPQLKADVTFIEESAMLHDIGIYLTRSPSIDCTGDSPYICHGYLGREILEREGFPRHALVCERHVGTGISLQEIIDQKLPLPKRDMCPCSIEEEIICYADKFFSKNQNSLSRKKSHEQIRSGLLPYGTEKVDQFDRWAEIFVD
ncbi:MAG: HDIG domain-containing protein [Fibrobacteria bacterium]|nr:HDIG domain-containing protein [Fibrobacteria bacterium]